MSNGCEMMKCRHYQNEACTHPGDVCIYRCQDEQIYSLQSQLKTCEGKNKIALKLVQELIRNGPNIEFEELKRLEQVLKGEE